MPGISIPQQTSDNLITIAWVGKDRNPICMVSDSKDILGSNTIEIIRGSFESPKYYCEQEVSSVEIPQLTNQDLISLLQHFHDNKIDHQQLSSMEGADLTYFEEWSVINGTEGFAFHTNKSIHDAMELVLQFHQAYISPQTTAVAQELVDRAVKDEPEQSPTDLVSILMEDKLPEEPLGAN